MTIFHGTLRQNIILSNKFHEFWCSRVVLQDMSKIHVKRYYIAIYSSTEISHEMEFEFLCCKAGSNKYLGHTNAKSSSSRSKRIYYLILLPSQIIRRLTFLTPSLTTRLIQKFVQNINFLSWLGILIKVPQE
jgi:hypothetical protein